MSETEEWYKLRNLIFLQDYDGADRLLNLFPELIHERNGLGETVLHFLAVENELDGIKWLKNKGFTVNTQNDFGQSPLFEAAQLEYKELVKWLVSVGVDFSHKDQNGDDIWQYLEGYGCREMIQYLRTLIT